MSTPFTEDAGIPVIDPTPFSSYNSVVLPVAGRPVPLQVKVSAPVTGSDLPVILMSHGHGPSNFVSSSRGYGPVVEFWAARGFVVLQPTHLDSTALGLREADDADAPLYARARAQDMRQLLDHLPQIEATVPGLAGRVDRSRVAAVGHSMGGHTVGVLCGQTIDPTDEERLADPRVSVGVLLAPPGNGEDLADFASTHYPVLKGTSFAAMTTPALVVVGENDWNPMFSERKDWRSDAFHFSPAPKSLLTLFDAEHALGGVSMWDGAETTDENPRRVAALRALVWAYLRSQLFPGDSAWTDAVRALNQMPEPVGAVRST